MELVFVIPEEAERLRTLIKMCLYLVDRLAQFKLSPAAYQKSEKNRQKLLEEQLKQQTLERQEVISSIFFSPFSSEFFRF